MKMVAKQIGSKKNTIIPKGNAGVPPVVTQRLEQMSSLQAKLPTKTEI